MLISTDASHPGKRIKSEILPSGMSISKAAQLLGVSRPALSNLLNGKASLSADMSARLEKAFKYPRENLMEMQARYDAAQAKEKDAPVATKAYVPPFLAIKAVDIERWVSRNISARIRLAVFLRKLVHSTGGRPTKVDFPGNDDAERPGWDGFVETTDGTPWVPVGRSGWEFGTNEDPKAKAEGDFEKSVKACDKKDRAETTFVFVTPRPWVGKLAWVAAKKAKGLWKDVRVYDASDLEQWLEQSLAAQAWFANETLLPAQDVRSLDKCWEEWSSVSTPPLSGMLFNSAIEACKRTVLGRLSKPPEGPITIAADSVEEALAFLDQLLGEHGGEALASYRDRVLVFDKAGVLPRLAAGAQNLIAVVVTREAERELAPFASSMHSIVVYPRNAVTVEPTIVLEPASHDTFNKALEEMGKGRDEISRLADASGRSLTVLRRQLSTVPAVRTPHWATDRPTAASLVPFMFLGAWNSQNEIDKFGLSLLAGGRSYEELERDCQSISQLNDAPIWSVGSYRGIISKIDLLYSIAARVTADDLKRYFSMARMVLGEDDPSLDLNEDQRWAASIYGKAREFSGSFREGISETLVLLSVHGSHLFRDRLGIDTEFEATSVIRDLLPTPLTTRILEANDRDLPTYAETAPDEFLSILEFDLKSEDPAVLGLLHPVPTGALGRSPSRTGLLWALENLSWNPETLPRAVYILGWLAQVEINDNWINKPTNSLQSIFSAWMPQTAANHEQRLSLLKKLAEKFPNVAWNICVAQFSQHSRVGHYSHKPRWRPDGYGFGEPFPMWRPILDFVRDMVEMALTWEDHSLEMLCDLVERVLELTEVDQARVWALIETWATTKASDSDKAKMREKVRISALSRRAASRAKKRDSAATDLATAGRAAYVALEPRDVINKHAWLFHNAWLEESADEIEDIEEFDYDQRDKRITQQRTEALREILEQRGLDGILEICKRGNASGVIGVLLTTVVLSNIELLQLLQLALAGILTKDDNIHPNKILISSSLRALQNDGRHEAILTDIAASLSEQDAVQLLVLSPFCRSTWKFVDTLGEDARAKYWSAVAPDEIYDLAAERSEAVERLLAAERPRAAFSCVRYEMKSLDTQLLFRLMTAIVEGGKDEPGHDRLDQYYVGQAFKRLGSDATLTLDQKAGLEFAYIEVLARPWERRESYGIPNLERYVEEHPELFVQAIVWTYERKDGAADPSEFKVPPDRVKVMAERGYKLLEAIERIPGHNDLDELDADRLAKWIATVRQSGAELGRTDIADRCIGRLLSCAPVGDDGVWPCEPVRNVMEDIQSDSVMESAQIGVYNSRGAHWRGEGGDQERGLAETYRNWGQSLQISHPFVSSKLLMRLATGYDRDANREDTDAKVRRRLR